MFERDMNDAKKLYDAILEGGLDEV